MNKIFLQRLFPVYINLFFGVLCSIVLAFFGKFEFLIFFSFAFVGGFLIYVLFSKLSKRESSNVTLNLLRFFVMIITVSIPTITVYFLNLNIVYIVVGLVELLYFYLLTIVDTWRGQLCF